MVRQHTLAPKRFLIIFDLDSELLESGYGLEDGSADLRRVFTSHRFTNLQGTVYLGEIGVRQAHCVLALQDAAIRFPWFGACVSDARIFNVTQVVDAQFLVDGVSLTRRAFAFHLADLRRQLTDAGLPLQKVDEIVASQAVPLSVFPAWAPGHQ